MRKGISTLLAVILLLTVTVFWQGEAYALPKEKEQPTRAIAIVFDNSGSMYKGNGDGPKAWCRATYAMEVFAAMLNKGDTLLIYPMSPITVGAAEYTMNNPYKITDSAQANTIREIYTPLASITPIESVDCALEGLSKVKADKKTVIVLTDGNVFYKNWEKDPMSKDNSRKELDSRFEKANKDIGMMYLGIGGDVVMPNTGESEYFAKKQAKDSKDVLFALTEMCNQIFGRDTLPKTRFSGNGLDFDISLSKLIVFVQGENISNLSVTSAGTPVGTKTGETSTRYSEQGCGGEEEKMFDVDTALQGTMVTYEDCAPGQYQINYDGEAGDIEVYYEPDADLNFVFTDAAGNEVDPNALYEGEYTLSYGLKDAKTGKLIQSDLLGKTEYKGKYIINGKEHEIKSNGQSGVEKISLSMGDTFDAQLTVTYLSGYTITKNTENFGWPNGGITVSARPAGELRLDISGGESLYSLKELEAGEPYIAKVYYEGKQLKGDGLENTKLKWEVDKSNAEVKKEFCGDHYKLTLHYKDPAAPQNTACGECTVDIFAQYTPQGCNEAQAQAPLSYNIEDDFCRLELGLSMPNDYIVISELGETKPIKVNLLFDGEKLSPKDFNTTTLDVDCGGIDFTLTPNEGDSSYTVQLQDTPGIAEGNYTIRAAARYVDNIGRVSEVEESAKTTLSNMPLWLWWGIRIAALLLLIIIVLIILHIKVLPKHAYTPKRDSRMMFDGEDETISTTFDAKLSKRQLSVQSKFAGEKTGVSMNVKPSKDSYLRKPQKRRSGQVASNSVKKIGMAKIEEVTIGSIRYVFNDETKKLERVPKSDKPFTVKHGTRISCSGTMNNGGIEKPFAVSTKLKFTKR